MRALDEGRDYALRNPRSGAEVRRLEARRVWQLIAQLAWKSGEPGVIFIDRINAQNPTPALGEMESTNPCGELPLLPFEACNLASIDVGKLVVDGQARLAAARRARLRTGVRFLDDVIDVNHYPLPQIEEHHARQPQDRPRRHGLRRRAHPHGRRLRLRSGARRSPTSWRAFIEQHAQAASAELARERGPFANWKGSRWERQGSPPLRNATTTTIAPTGTLSILAGCSGGIEPLYAVSFVRQVLDGDRLVDVHPLFVGGGAGGRLVLGGS